MHLKTASLPDIVLAIIRDKGTELPFTGEYNNIENEGTFLCRQCGLALYRTHKQFHSGCGWPSFDEALPNAISQQVDADGRRQEILCARCQAHLGHVFSGEHFTPANTRYCVNSVSLDFVTDLTVLDTEEAIFAAGCFWGVEYYFKRLPGVLKTEVGYSGGHARAPTYQTVCSGTTGHYEAIRVIYDPQKVSYTQLVQFFFEIHDPTQVDGQGPDRGTQYLSAIFYYTEQQAEMANAVLQQLQHKGYQITTQLLPVSPFWRAETYHQDYYAKHQQQPYCHRYEKKF